MPILYPVHIICITLLMYHGSVLRVALMGYLVCTLHEVGRGYKSLDPAIYIIGSGVMKPHCISYTTCMSSLPSLSASSMV